MSCEDIAFRWCHAVLLTLQHEHSYFPNKMTTSWKRACSLYYCKHRTTLCKSSRQFLDIDLLQIYELEKITSVKKKIASRNKISFGPDFVAYHSLSQ